MSEKKSPPAKLENLPSKNMAKLWFGAAERGDLATLKSIHERYPSLLEAQDEDHRASAMWVAAHNKKPKAVQLLLSWGADANKTGVYDYDCLMVAADNRDLKTLRLVLPSCDAKRHSQGGPASRKTALMIGLGFGWGKERPAREDWIAWMKKSDLSAVCSSGATAFYFAMMEGRSESGRLPLEVLADLDPLRAMDEYEGVPMWRWALTIKEPWMADLFGSRPQCESIRRQVIAEIKAGELKARDFPQIWAMEEAKLLRKEAEAARSSAVATKPVAAEKKAPKRI